MKPLLKDSALEKSKALPNGAAATTCDAIDLGHGSHGDFVADVEFEIEAPALGATPMPDAKTMKYDVIHSDSSDLSGPSTLIAAAITQTGAGGAGCDAATYRFRLPTSVKRYVGVKATGSGSGNASGSSFTLRARF